MCSQRLNNGVPILSRYIEGPLFIAVIFAVKWDNRRKANACNRPLAVVYGVYFSWSPQSERLCPVGPLVSVHVCSTLVGRVDHVPVLLSLLLSSKKLSIHMNEQPQSKSEVMCDSSFYTFM
jgi:hypothetical protein